MRSARSRRTRWSARLESLRRRLAGGSPAASAARIHCAPLMGGRKFSVPAVGIGAVQAGSALPAGHDDVGLHLPGNAPLTERPRERLRGMVRDPVEPFGIARHDSARMGEPWQKPIAGSRGLSATAGRARVVMAMSENPAALRSASMRLTVVVAVRRAREEAGGSAGKSPPRRSRPICEGAVLDARPRRRTGSARPASARAAPRGSLRPCQERTSRRTGRPRHRSSRRRTAAAARRPAAIDVAARLPRGREVQHRLVEIGHDIAACPSQQRSQRTRHDPTACGRLQHIGGRVPPRARPYPSHKVRTRWARDRCRRSREWSP